MTETTNNLLFVEVSRGALEPANRLHFGVHPERLVPRHTRLLLGPFSQPVQFVRLEVGRAIGGRDEEEEDKSSATGMRIIGDIRGFNVNWSQGSSP